MDCGIPFCHQGCPLGNIIPDWNDLVYKDHWREAIERLHATNNFPEFTGRLCPAPCEAACVLGINSDPVTIKQVELTIIEHALKEGWIKPEKPDRDHRQARRRRRLRARGPGRGAAARPRRPRRHAVRARRPHRRAAPLRHPRLQDGEVGHRPAHGADGRGRRHLQARASTSAWTSTPRDLLKEYDAICLTGGATQPRDLQVPGRELKGTYFAMEFLPLQNHRNAGDEIPDEQFISARRASA